MAWQLEFVANKFSIFRYITYRMNQSALLDERASEYSGQVRLHIVSIDGASKKQPRSRD